MNEKSIYSWIKITKRIINQNQHKQSKIKQNTIAHYFHQLTSTPQPSASTLTAAPGQTIGPTSIEDAIRITENTNSNRELKLTTNEHGISPVLNNQHTDNLSNGEIFSSKQPNQQEQHQDIPRHISIHPIQRVITIY